MAPVGAMEADPDLLSRASSIANAPGANPPAPGAANDEYSVYSYYAPVGAPAAAADKMSPRSAYSDVPSAPRSRD